MTPTPTVQCDHAGKCPTPKKDCPHREAHKRKGWCDVLFRHCRGLKGDGAICEEVEKEQHEANL